MQLIQRRIIGVILEDVVVNGNHVKSHLKGVDEPSRKFMMSYDTNRYVYVENHHISPT